MITRVVTRISTVIAIRVEGVGRLRHFLEHSHSAIRAEQDPSSIIPRNAATNGRRLAYIAKELHGV